jgi:hypothetical protein
VAAAGGFFALVGAGGVGACERNSAQPDSVTASAATAAVDDIEAKRMQRFHNSARARFSARL